MGQMGLAKLGKSCTIKIQVYEISHHHHHSSSGSFRRARECFMPVMPPPTMGLYVPSAMAAGISSLQIRISWVGMQYVGLQYIGLQYGCTTA